MQGMGIDPKPDLVFAKVASEQLDEYLHVEVLFYPIGAVAGLQMPQLTIGSWLETTWRLQALASTLQSDQQAALDQAQAQVKRIHSRVPELYTQKAHRECRSRLDTWNWYLDDMLARRPLATPPEGQAYSTYVHVRLKLELLKEDVAQPADQLARLEAGDRRLYRHFAAGSFVWEPELVPQAPADTYWWLYGHPS